MNEPADPAVGFSCESTCDHPGSDRYTGAFFPNAQHFVISNGTFTSNVNIHHAIPTLPADFRWIPLGDINLETEIRLEDRYGLVRRRREVVSARRMYSAKIGSGQSDMMVALYQGGSAKEAWREDILRGAAVRHPRFVQIFALASSSGIHAIVSYGDLIPFHHYLEFHRQSHFATIYIYGCCDAQFEDALQYFRSTFQSDLHEDGCTFWMHRSTGQLCIDLTPSGTFESFLPTRWTLSTPDSAIPLNDSNPEARIIGSLSVDQYHRLCYWHLRKSHFFSVALRTELNLGVVVFSPSGSQLNRSVEIAFLSDLDTYFSGWQAHNTAVPHIMKEGSTRYKSHDVFDTIISSKLVLGNPKSWLSQANQIFSRLGTTSSYEDFHAIYLRVQLSTPSQNPPNGYLFIRPIKHLRSGPRKSFQLPDCPAYWALDLRGAEPLTPDFARRLGFPSIKLTTVIKGSSWDAKVYAGLRRFGKIKDRGVVQDFDWPLYHSSNIQTSSADGDGHVSNAEDDGEVTSVDIGDHEHLIDGCPDDEKLDEYITEVCADEETAGSHVDVFPSSYAWKVVCFIKFALILVLACFLLCETSC